MINPFYFDSYTYTVAHKGVFWVATAYFLTYNFKQYTERVHMGRYKHALDYMMHCENTAPRLEGLFKVNL